jgi:predicted Zn-dependent peptidase
MTENYQLTTLSNGLRIVSENVPHVASAAVGFWVQAGSRDETYEEQGLSHFLEHMVFKGTTKRPSPKQIADEVDAIGGYMNAFTDREHTCYYMRTLAGDVTTAIDILSDMLTDPLFPVEETHRERGVVLEEIKQRDDDPEDLVHDIFAETLFPKHALGVPVIGRADVIATAEPEHLRKLMAERYQGNRITIALSGNVNHDLVVEQITAAMGHLGRGTVRTPLALPTVCTGRNYVSEDTEQVHFCLGQRGPSHHTDDRYAAMLLDCIIGGSMGSRLFQEIREKRGLAYSIGSYVQPYDEIGVTGAYGGTSMESFELCLDVIQTEFAKLRTSGVEAGELSRAKTQFRSALIMGQESMSSRMTRLGKALLTYDEITPLDEVVSRIDRVTLADVQTAAENYLPKSLDDCAVVALGPFGDSE